MTNFTMTSRNDIAATEAHHMISTGDLIEISPSMKPGFGDVVLRSGEKRDDRDVLEVYSDITDKDRIRGVAVAKVTRFR